MKTLKPYRIWLVLVLLIAGCGWYMATHPMVEHPDTAFHLP